MNSKVILGLAGITLSATVIAANFKTHPRLTLLGLIFISPVGVLVGSELGQNPVKNQLKLKTKELADTRLELKTCQIQNADLKQVLVSEAQLKKANQTLVDECQKLQAELKRTKEALTFVQQLVQGKEAENSRLVEQNKQINNQLSDWMDSFDESVEIEGEKRFQQFKSEMLGEIKERFFAAVADHSDLIQMAQNLKDRAVQGCFYIEEQNRSQHDYFMKVFDQYQAVNSATEDKEAELLVQIEALQKKCVRLELKLSGVLPEPEYLPQGFSVHREIANSFAKLVWDNLKVPLAVKGSQLRSNGLIEMGYGYSAGTDSKGLVELLNSQSEGFAKQLHIHKITGVKEHDLSPLIIVGLRREPEVKEDTVKLLAGSPVEFIDYITSHPIRYRLIADPGKGKTPTTAVMLSSIITSGGTLGNTGKGKKIPHTATNLRRDTLSDKGGSLVRGIMSRTSSNSTISTQLFSPLFPAQKPLLTNSHSGS